MLAYKVLKGSRSEFTGWRWPLPSKGQPGSWISVSGRLELCANGIHACTVDQLPQWLGTDLWEIELDGEIVETDAALLASRGRLVRGITRWDDDARRSFSAACAERATEIGARYPRGADLVSRITEFATFGYAAACGYWTALLTGESESGARSGPEYDRAFARERTLQAQWLRREMELP